MLGVCIAVTAGLLAVRYSTNSVPATVKAALPIVGSVFAIIMGVFEVIASKRYVSVANQAIALHKASSVFVGGDVRLLGSVTLLTLLTYIVVIGFWLVVWWGR